MEGDGDVLEKNTGGGKGRRYEILVEMRTQVVLVGPLISVNVFFFALQIISVMLVGHLGQLPLASASLATSFCTVVAFSVLIGMSSALETFCGQANGAGEHHMLGVYMQRAMLILAFLNIPLVCIVAFTGRILLAMKQDPEIAEGAGSYARWLIPCIISYGLMQCHLRFLQSQKIVVPMMVCSGITTLLHLPMCWALVFKSGLGNRGAALANGISGWLNLILLAIYIRTSQSCKKTWLGFSSEAFSGIVDYFRLAVPSAVMICLEFWSFEVLIFASGLLPNPRLETSVLSICLNTRIAVYMFGLGMGTAVSVRVSNALGAGHPRGAQSALFAGASMASLLSCAIAAIMISISHVWGKFYSKDVDVIVYVAKMMPILAAGSFMDVIACAFSGAVRGSGRQRLGVFVNLGAYYIVGIPAGIIMAFVLKFHGKGIWLGITLALLVQLTLLLVITSCTNWEKEAKRAKDRISNGKEGVTNGIVLATQKNVNP